MHGWRGTQNVYVDVEIDLQCKRLTITIRIDERKLISYVQLFYLFAKTMVFRRYLIIKRMLCLRWKIVQNLNCFVYILQTVRVYNHFHGNMKGDRFQIAVISDIE